MWLNYENNSLLDIVIVLNFSCKELRLFDLELSKLIGKFYLIRKMKFAKSPSVRSGSDVCGRKYRLK